VIIVDMQSDGLAKEGERKEDARRLASVPAIL
jgi:hypothetical protein